MGIEDMESDWRESGDTVPITQVPELQALFGGTQILNPKQAEQINETLKSHSLPMTPGTDAHTPFGGEEVRNCTKQEEPLKETLSMHSLSMRELLHRLPQLDVGKGTGTQILTGQEPISEEQLKSTLILNIFEEQTQKEHAKAPIGEEIQKDKEAEEARRVEEEKAKEYRQAIERIELYTTLAQRLSEAHKSLVHIERHTPGSFSDMHHVLERIEHALTKSLSTRPEDLLPVAESLLPISEYYLTVGMKEAELGEEDTMKAIEAHFWQRVKSIGNFDQALKEAKSGGVGGASIDALAKITPVFELITKKMSGMKGVDAITSMGNRSKEFLRTGLVRFAQNQMHFMAVVEEELRIFTRREEAVRNVENLSDQEIQEYLQELSHFRFVRSARDERLGRVLKVLHEEVIRRGKKTQETVQKKEIDEVQQEVSPESLIQNIREKIMRLPMGRLAAGGIISLATLLTLTTSNVDQSYAEQETQGNAYAMNLATPTVSAAPKPEVMVSVEVQEREAKGTIAGNHGVFVEGEKEVKDFPIVTPGSRSVLPEATTHMEEKEKKGGFFGRVKQWFGGKTEEKMTVKTGSSKEANTQKLPTKEHTPTVATAHTEAPQAQKTSLFAKTKNALLGKKSEEVKSTDTYVPSVFKKVGHVAPLTEVKDAKTGKSTFFGYLMAGEKEMQKAMESIKADFPGLTSLTPKIFIDGQEAGVGVFTAQKNIQFQLNKTEGKTVAVAFEVSTANGNVRYVQAGEGSWKVSKTYVQ